MMHRFSKIGLLVSILSVFMFPSCHKVEVFEMILMVISMLCGLFSMNDTVFLSIRI